MTIRLPDDFDHHTADLGSIRLHYVREGQGEPVILMHGWPGFWWEWRKNIGPLAADFDVIVPDMRGFGDSEKPDLSNIDLYGTLVATDDLANLLDHLNVERATLVGHDYAAIVIHKFARKYRERVERAVVMDPIVPGFDTRYMSAEHFSESWYAKFHQLDMAVELVGSSRADCRSYFAHFLSHWSSDPALFSDEELEVYTDNYMKPGNIQGGFNFYRSGQRKTWTDLDYTISSCPMTFLQGMADPCIPARWTDLIPSWYTNFTLEYVPDAGHFMMCETPDLVNDRVRRACLAS